MKKHRGKPIVQITDPKVEDYAREMTTSESEAIQALVKSSDKELEFIDMLSGNLVGQLLKMLIKTNGAKRVLEVGTFTGYSALTMAEALPDDGEVITLEMNIRYQALAEKHFKAYDVGQKIQLIKGNAREELEDVPGEFDLIFIDADKLGYPAYFELCLPKLKANGLMVIDNVLWDATVLDPQDEKSKAVDAFNKQIAADDRVEQVLLPVRDGVTVLAKK